MQTLAEIRAALAVAGLAPNRSLGQNFLIDHNLLRRLVDDAGVGTGDLVLEVGPGTGALTDELLERGCEVVACEIDRGLADLLEARYRDERAGGRFTLVRGDCLARKSEINPELTGALAGRPFRLVANLPYGAASPLMVALATGAAPCLGQHATIQKEVAERLRAEPGSRDYGELTVMIGALCDVRRVATLGPECFWPRPKVTSEMVAITPRPGAAASVDPARLGAVCRRLFTRRRKQIGSTLGRDFPFPEGVDPSARPESLPIDRFVALAEAAPA